MKGRVEIKGVEKKGEENFLEEKAERKKERWKGRSWQAAKVILAVLLVLLLIYAGWKSVDSIGIMLKNEKIEEVSKAALEPTVEIVDESGMRAVSGRVKEYVAKVEESFLKQGRKVTRAVLPGDKRREVDVYLEGMTGYFKMSLDREVEDEVAAAMWMIEYLSGREFSYVDVRVEGKAYYK